MSYHLKVLVIYNFFISIFFSTNCASSNFNDLNDIFQKKFGYTLPVQSTFQKNLSAHPQFSKVETNPNYVAATVTSIKSQVADLIALRQGLKSGGDPNLAKNIDDIKKNNLAQIGAIEKRAQALLASSDKNDKIKGALLYKHLAYNQLRIKKDEVKFLEYLCYAAEYNASAAGFVAIIHTLPKDNLPDKEQMKEILKLKKLIKKDPLRDLLDKYKEEKHQQQLTALQKQKEKEVINSWWAGFEVPLIAGGIAVTVVGVVGSFLYWLSGEDIKPPPSAI